jgi:hypothetical protein
LKRTKSVFSQLENWTLYLPELFWSVSDKREAGTGKRDNILAKCSGAQATW